MINFEKSTNILVIRLTTLAPSDKIDTIYDFNKLSFDIKSTNVNKTTASNPNQKPNNDPIEMTNSTNIIFGVYSISKLYWDILNEYPCGR